MPLDNKLIRAGTAASQLTDSELSLAANDILRASYLNDFIPHDSIVRVIQKVFVEGHIPHGTAFTCAKQAVMEEVALRWLKNHKVKGPYLDWPTGVKEGK